MRESRESVREDRRVRERKVRVVQRGQSGAGCERSGRARLRVRGRRSMLGEAGLIWSVRITGLDPGGGDGVDSPYLSSQSLLGCAAQLFGAWNRDR